MAGDVMVSYDEIKGAEGGVDEMSVRKKYNKLTNDLIEKKLMITTMESCTCGQIASLITDTEGSSAVMKGACITYSNEAKVMEGVPSFIIEEHGVYSAETSEAMAKVCRDKYDADIGVGVTGSFGNVDLANKDSIPGEVYFSIAKRDSVRSWHCVIPKQGSRLDYKLYMADVIADCISLSIENN
jgi:nicotinamide-nucleotide amidase